MAKLPLIRSLLFSPGSDERKLARALASDADAVVADLEDAVALDRKAEARETVARVLGERGEGPARLVRVNAAGTEFFDADLALLRDLDLDGVVLPMATPEGVAALGPEGPPVIAVVETALGLRSAFEIASAPRVEQLQLGGGDLGTELRLAPRADGQELLFARSSLVVDSAAAGIRPPIDVVFLEVGDLDGLERECALAHSLGLRAKACIHPAQIETVNRAFAPTSEELEWAREVLAGYEAAASAGQGAVVVRGQFVDLAHVGRARTLIADSGGADR